MGKKKQKSWHKPFSSIPSTNSSTHSYRIWEYCTDHPKAALVLAFIALAATFSPRLSMLGAWTSIVCAFVFFIALIGGVPKIKHSQHSKALAVIFSVFAASALATYGVWLTESKSPKLEVSNISLQPISQNSLRFLLFAKDVGQADGSIEIQYTISSTDHLATQKHRAEVETYLFSANFQKIGGSSAQVIDIFQGQDVTFTLEQSNTELVREILDRFNNNGALYLTAAIWYVGRPDLGKFEICEYWTADSPHKPKACHAHNDALIQ